ncbi:hypothetical protein CMQ_3797 [Grosmannia clavigera kw1407]|uniref:Uncharacterized protein n=1 Tax=Grosmannia clavigera (strain kw1407 / UAMH 11150) TaxID=655863 RepID=F0X8W8_GROCL|nr:uncharacterized protein CMQ_3797 [Grosmannia clavigera kw1407]EFX05728.1 hypothetical protein CMQ_3797 [Grosmannia clavigera kw1407]
MEPPHRCGSRTQRAYSAGSLFSSTTLEYLSGCARMCSATRARTSTAGSGMPTTPPKAVNMQLLSSGMTRRTGGQGTTVSSTSTPLGTNGGGAGVLDVGAGADSDAEGPPLSVGTSMMVAPFSCRGPSVMAAASARSSGVGGKPVLSVKLCTPVLSRMSSSSCASVQSAAASSVTVALGPRTRMRIEDIVSGRGDEERGRGNRAIRSGSQDVFSELCLCGQWSCPEVVFLDRTKQLCRKLDQSSGCEQGGVYRRLQQTRPRLRSVSLGFFWAAFSKHKHKRGLSDCRGQIGGRLFTS